MVFAAAPSQDEVLLALAETELVAWERVNAFQMDEYLGLERGAVRHTLYSEISERYPATILRRHAHVVLFLDEESAGHG